MPRRLSPRLPPAAAVALGRPRLALAGAVLACVLVGVGVAQLGPSSAHEDAVGPEAGRPGRLALVGAFPGHVRARLVTDLGEVRGAVDGALPLELPAVVEPMRLVVEAEGRRRWVRPVAAGTRRVRIEDLEPGGTITFTAREPEGAPAAGVRLRLVAPGEALPFEAVTDDAGRAEVAHLPRGVGLALRARSPRHATARRRALRAPAHVELELHPVGRLVGRVLGPEGPVADAEVLLVGSGLWPARERRTDDRGRYRFGEVPPGVYEVQARAGGLVSERRRGLRLDAGAPHFVTLDVSVGATLVGVVRDASTGDGLAGVRLTVSSFALDAAPRSTVSGPDGRFRVAGLAPAEHHVAADAEGYVSRPSIAWRPGEALELRLEQAGTVAGRVLDADGLPVAGAQIEVLGETPAGQPVLLGPGAAFRAAVVGARDTSTAGALAVTSGAVPPIPLDGPGLAALPEAGPEEARLARAFVTDAMGRFRVGGIPTGWVQVLVGQSGYARASTDRLHVSAGQVRDGLELRLLPAGTVRGRVVNDRGDGVAGVPVEIRSDTEPFPELVLSDDNGGFVVEGVTGELAVTARPLDRPAVRRRVRLVPDEEATVELPLEGDLQRLYGRVVDARGFPLAGVPVRVRALRAESPGLRVAESGDDGTFVLDGLPSGPWRLDAGGRARGSASLDVPSADGEVTVRLAAVAAVEGEIRSGFSGELLDAWVVVSRDTLPPETHRVRAPGGHFRVPGLSAGAWRLAARADGHLERKLAFTIERRGPSLVDTDLGALRLAAGGALAGVVVDARGRPVPRAHVRVAAPAGAGTRADPAGAFVLEPIAPGLVHLEGEAPTAGTGRSGPHRVDAGRETPGVVLRLDEVLDEDRPGTASGRRQGVALAVAGAGDELRVAWVGAASRAAEAGLRPGDVLLTVDGWTPEDAEDAGELLRGPPGVAAVIEVRRAGETAVLLVERESYLPGEPP
ncbi:MAG: carboxypeptidase regulatory-like domain-containing protein [Sandaracinaceae bacterium]